MTFKTQSVALAIACTVASIGATGNPKFPSQTTYVPPITATVSDKLVAENLPGSKPLLQMQRGDLEVTIGGSTKFETFFARNVVMLNNNLPDEFGYIRHVMDLSTHLAFGEKQYGHKALELFADVRQKNMWGNTGITQFTTDDMVKVSSVNVATGSHSHRNTKPLMWIRDFWMNMSINALTGIESNNKHYFKLGLFPYQVGRGIALGTVYGASKEFLGIYTGYQNDQSAPGMTVYGNLLENRLKYDFYYAKLEEKSSSLRDTFNTIKSNHVGKRAKPFRGVSKDNDLFVAHFTVKALKDHEWGELNLEPYIIYNEASDRQIEFEADAKSTLGIAGISFEYKNKNFEWGAETAFNFGQETVYHIDRNIVELGVQRTAVGTEGSVIKQYSHIVDTAGNKIPVTSDIQSVVNGSSNVDNGAKIGEGTVNGAANTELFNKSNRFRPEYQNKYAGWMFVTDAAYKLDNINTKIAATFGYASGDTDPHSVEENKTYDGFIGLQEAYSGKRVPSVLVLDARKIKRPLTLNPDFDREAGDDASFTDMWFFGTGIKWLPIENNEKKFFLNTNLLGFWKDQRSGSFDLTSGSVTSDLAGQFLGLEWNIRGKYEMLKDLYMFGDFALFVPGSFYNDIKGTPLRGDVFNKLNRENQNDLSANDYRLGNDSAYYINLGLTYKF